MSNLYVICVGGPNSPFSKTAVACVATARDSSFASSFVHPAQTFISVEKMKTSGLIDDSPAR